MMPASSEWQFATARLATGPTLHYAKRGDARGEAILFLHGWPDSWFSFSRVLRLLPRLYRSIALDQRGFGDSDRPINGYRIEDLAADAAAFLDAVAIERATIVGHSLGSFIARRVAMACPERVARLVLIGSAMSPVNQVTREVRTSLQSLADPVPAAFAREFQASTAHLPLPDDFFDTIVAESLKLPARLWREVFDSLLDFDDMGQLERIVAPTLLIWGERDALFPREDQDRLAAAIPDVRLRVYPETGHCPNWERPELVASDLVTFMQETSVRPTGT
jgi:pimeloyl-ACP methyl ester carboxylesterase